jgi:hypothetical protein
MTGRDLETEEGPPKEGDIKILLYHCVAAYRMANAKGDRDEVCKKLVKFGRTCPWRLAMAEFCTESLFGVGGNPAVAMMVAAIDMFVCKFPDHEWALLRIGSRESQMKECTVVSDLSHLSQITGLEPDILVEWIFEPSVAQEWKAFKAMDDELDKADSYFPYLKDMQLTPRSPYTTTAKPQIHNWVHLVGSFMGNARSRGAYQSRTPPSPNLILGSALMAYCCSRDGSTTASDQEEMMNPHGGSNLSRKTGLVMKAADALRWFDDPKNRNLIYEFIDKVKVGCTNGRQNSYEALIASRPRYTYNSDVAGAPAKRPRTEVSQLD